VAEGIKERVHRVIEEGEGRAGRAFGIALTLLIALNVAAVLAGTVKDLARDHGPLLDAIEHVSVAIFSLELLARLWCCTVDPRFAHPLLGRLRFLVQPMTLIDLVAILPALLPFMSADLRSARAARLLRLLRLLKVGRYSESVRTLGRVLVAKREELAVTGLIVLVLLVIASSVMYHVEHDAQPNQFSSIPATMWWGIATLTTVGYGDVYPVTPLGRFLGAFIALSGVGLVALPAGILASGFADELRERRAAAAKASPARCPHCQGELPT
jgi:voltage-gated potassium channel